MKITKENYEEFALDFIEGNLNADDQKQFEAFLDAHPVIRKSMDDFELVVLPSFTPTMPNKSILYHDNSRIKPFIFYIRRVAAVILALIIFSAVLTQLNRQPGKALVQQEEIKDKMLEELPDRNIALEDKPEIKANGREAGEITTPAKITSTKSDPDNGEIEQIRKLSRTEIGEPVQEVALVTPDEIEKIRSPIQPIALIETIEIRPGIHRGYKIEQRPNLLLIENEDIQNDPFSKIGRLLARANLIPTGLQEEIGETSIREKIIPETYVDLK